MWLPAQNTPHSQCYMHRQALRFDSALSKWVSAWLSVFQYLLNLHNMSRSHWRPPHDLSPRIIHLPCKTGANEKASRYDADTKSN